MIRIVIKKKTKLETALKNIKNKKAALLDNIPTEF